MIPLQGRILLGAAGLALLAGLAAAAPDQVRARHTRPDFRPGEYLEFTLDYFNVVAGSGSFSMSSGPEKWEGQPAYRLESRAWSTPLFSNFYRVKDTNVSWLHTERYHSLGFSRDIVEGKYRGRITTSYYPEKGYALVNGSQRVPLDKQVQDPLSLLYYVRTLPLKVGARFPVPVYDGKYFVDVSVEVQKRERVTTPLGVFNALRVEPVMYPDEGIFRRNGRIWVWVTEDARHLPVQMKSKVFFGHIRAQLVKYRPAAVD